jgi:N4-gp56 family major capsid protein
MAGQIWALDTEGGYMFAPNLSEYMRMQNQQVVKFRQMGDVLEDDADGRPLLGKHRGDTWAWNVYSNLATTGRQLDETEVMPTSGFTVAQYSAKLAEYGNSVQYNGKLDDLSQQPITRIIDKQLKLDTAKTFDIATWNQFNQTLLRVTPLSGTSTTALDALVVNGVSTVTNNVAFGKGHVEPIVVQMKERGIPAFDNGDYYAIARPIAYQQIKSDLEGIQTYTETGLAQIKNGEIGRYRGVRFIEQTHIPQGGAYDTTTFNPQTNTSDPWNNTKSDWIFFMGADTVSEGVAIPEELRGQIPGDYGRQRGIAWYALIGFALTHPDALNARIIKWDSAA